MAEDKGVEGASSASTPLSPGLSGVAQQEMQWANAGEKLAVLNFSEKARPLRCLMGAMEVLQAS